MTQLGYQCGSGSADRPGGWPDLSYSACTLAGAAASDAQSITDDSTRASALASIAGALAATDPDRAEPAAQSITDDYSKARALVSIAGALAATDPDRAARLIDDAERAAQSITDSSTRATVLVSIAGALAAIRPGPLNFSLPYSGRKVYRGHLRRS